MPPASAVFTLHNEVELIRSGRGYFDRLLDLLGRANETIHFQTYIFADDHTAREVGDALMAAARRGVQVYLLIACRRLDPEFSRQLHEAGIHFRLFEPPGKYNYLTIGRRLHHKVVVVDGIEALVGGINVNNQYNDWPNQVPWLDFAARVRGEAARELERICQETGVPHWEWTPPDEPPHAPPLPPPGSRVRVRVNDWFHRITQVSDTYLEMFGEAREHLVIISSYFLPGGKFRNHLRRTARRGVPIQVIMTGYSDITFSKHAERHLYPWLLRQGIEVYEYDRSVLHAKLAVCDRRWLTVGSYNVNNLSAYLSIELNLDIEDPHVAGQAHDLLDRLIMEDCRRISEADLAKTTLYDRLLQWGSYQLVWFLLFVFTWYYRRKR
jgi:cardiolipin synthase